MPRLPRLRLLAWRARRVLRALLVAGLVGLAVRISAPSPAPATLVAVAARPVPAGQALTLEDVHLVRLPSGLAPSTAAGSVEAWIGRRATVDLPEGLVLVPSVLASGRFALDPPKGTVVVPVTIGGPLALRVGDRVEVVADTGCAPSSDPVPVTALVIGLGDLADGPDDVAEGTSGLASGFGLGATGTTADGAALLALAPQDGRRIAGLAPTCALGALIVP